MTAELGLQPFLTLFIFPCLLRTGHLEKSKFSPSDPRNNQGCGGRRSGPTQLIEVPNRRRGGIP